MISLSFIDDFFDLDFVGLPPKPYQPEEFLEAAVKLRGRINRDMESEEPGFWKEKYISEVPVDGLTTYYDNVWGTVHSNKDLGLLFYWLLVVDDVDCWLLWSVLLLLLFF